MSLRFESAPPAAVLQLHLKVDRRRYADRIERDADPLVRWRSGSQRVEVVRLPSARIHPRLDLEAENPLGHLGIELAAIEFVDAHELNMWCRATATSNSRPVSASMFTDRTPRDRTAGPVAAAADTGPYHMSRRRNNRRVWGAQADGSAHTRKRVHTRSPALARTFGSRSVGT